MQGHRVLLSPYAFGHNVNQGVNLSVSLVLKQIEAFPLFDSHLPVCRQFEEQYYRHYVWPDDSNGGGPRGSR